MAEVDQNFIKGAALVDCAILCCVSGDGKAVVDQHFAKKAALVDCVIECDVQCSLCVSDEAILVHNIINITECVASSVTRIDLSVCVCFHCICHSSVGVQLCWRVLYIISLILSVYWCKICNWVKWLFLCIVFSKCERGSSDRPGNKTNGSNNTKQMLCMSEGPASRPGNKMQWICALANKHLKHNIRTYYIIWRAQTVILNILKFTVSLRQQSLGLQASVLCGGELTIFRTNGSHLWLWHRVWCLCLYLWRGRARSICREKCSHHLLWHRGVYLCYIHQLKKDMFRFVCARNCGDKVRIENEVLF